MYYSRNNIIYYHKNTSFGVFFYNFGWTNFVAIKKESKTFFKFPLYDKINDNQLKQLNTLGTKI
jgi:hypothetical protein